MAQREFRASWRRFVFSILAIGIGVGAITGVQGLSRTLQHALSREARQLIASDLRLRIGAAARTEELSALAALTQAGAEITRVAETVSMVAAAAAPLEGERSPTGESTRQPSGASADSPTPILASLKAVETGYPFFGEVELQPAVSLHEVLKTSVVVSPDLLLRLNLKVGDDLRVGNVELPIGAILVKEPDRLASGVEFGPRVLLSRESLQLAGLIQFGSRLSTSYLIRLPSAGLSLDSARRTIRDHSDRFRMVDYRNPNPGLSRGLSRMATFLSLTGLLALLVGGLGVAMSMHAYLQQKLDNIAVLKSLGARSRQILRIYLTQTLMVALLGSLLGLAAGLLFQISFPALLRGLLELPTRLDWSAAVALQGVGIGVLATSALVLPTLLAIREVKAAEVFRRDVGGDSHPGEKRLARWLRPAPALLANLALIGTIASWLADSWRRGFGFVAVLIILLAVFTGLGRIMFQLPRRLFRPRSPAVRHGLANLCRPGSQAAVTFAVLAIGVTLTLTVYLLQTSLLREIVRSAPPDFPNLVLIGISEDERPGLWDFLRSAPGVIDAGEPVAAAPARLISIDGDSIRDRGLDDEERRFARTDFSLTWARSLPPYTALLQGEWWHGEPRPSQVSVGQFAARTLGVKPGSRLVFQCGEKEIQGVVANVRETESVRPGVNNQFIFSPGALQGLPLTYVANVRAQPAALYRLQKNLFERFPTVTSIDIQEMLAVIQKLVDRISTIIQFVAAFAIAASMAVLASSIASTRYRRVRETVLLKALGATRRKVATLHLVEFTAIGLLSGIAGSLLGAVLTSLLLHRFFQAAYQPDWKPLAGAVLGATLLAVVTGWFASASILKRKPLAVLREQ